MAPKDSQQGQRPSSKRKGVPGSSSENNAWRNKRQKVQRDARTLAVQTTFKAFKDGELDVGAFVKAREYEIRALEEGLARSKKSLTQRAFQQVPKELRRRTASHNAKRVPKRLRRQAVKEMVDDNTPTVTARRRKPTKHMRLRIETVKRLRALGAKRKTAPKSPNGVIDEAGLPAANAPSAIVTRTAKVKKNTLSTAPTPPAKFRKRQLHKTWLPTHVYHAKRAHMTPPREPLWRFSIPLTSTAKSYRPTHRASNERGAIAWDVSYMSCISLQGVEHSIQGVLKALNVGGAGDLAMPWGAKGDKWRNGTRVWQGWLYERDLYPSKPIAPATVIWHSQTLANNHTTASDEVGSTKVKIAKKPIRQVLIRVHPSAFMQLWEEILRLVKIQKPQVVAEDLRFEIGGIEITGPASTEALLAALQPVSNGDSGPYQDALQHTLAALTGVTNTAILPNNALLSFDVSDPRLRHPPRTIDVSARDDPTALYNILTNWPCDDSPEQSGLFDRNRRLASTRALSSQKAINRRKAMAAPGSYPDHVPQDPRIPVIAYAACDVQKGGKNGKGRQASWTLLMPWKAVLPVWQSIMYYPLSTGGQVRLGGLQEKRQVVFETGSPWFPGDFPETEAGMAWNAMETARRRKDWERHPKGKRVEWSSVKLGAGRTGELGDGCACDWTYLASHAARPLDATVATDSAMTDDDTQQQQQQQKSSAVTVQPTPPASDGAALSSVGRLLTVRLKLLSRGVPNPCARIYRLPPTEDLLRSQWLAHDPMQTSRKTTANNNHRRSLLATQGLRGVPQAKVQQMLAADLLTLPDAKDSKSDSDHPDVPHEKDLVGFVTTGEFCLTEGKGVAIGSIVQGMMEPRGQSGNTVDRSSRLCIVRNAGETVGRLAEWAIV